MTSQALAAYPNDDNAHQAMATVLGTQGRYDEANAENERALTPD